MTVPQTPSYSALLTPSSLVPLSAVQMKRPAGKRARKFTHRFRGGLYFAAKKHKMWAALLRIMKRGTDGVRQLTWFRIIEREPQDRPYISM